MSQMYDGTLKQQWRRCRDRGLTVVVSKPVGSTERQAWIKADEVESLLEGINTFLVALEDVLAKQRLRIVEKEKGRGK